MLDYRNIDVLPTDVMKEFSKFLDSKSLGAISRVSKRWFSAFSDPNIWKIRIKEDFGIEQRILSQFDKHADSNQFHKNLYARLYDLRQSYSKLPQYMKNVYNDVTKQFLVLTCCMDNAAFAFKNIPCEEHYTLVMMALAARCYHIPIHYCNTTHSKREYLLNEAIRLGHIGFVRILLPPGNPYHVTYSNFFVMCLAVQLGSPQLVEYLSDPDHKFGLSFGKTRLKEIATSGSLELMQGWLNPKNNFGLYPDQDVLQAAVASGSFELMRYLLNPDNNFGLHPNQDTLNRHAAKSGNVEIVRYLLDPDNKFSLYPDEPIMYYAAQSGNFHLIDFLLTQKNVSMLCNDKRILDNAAYSGNLELLQVLLNSEIDFGKPSENTLRGAVRSGNLEMVRYMFNPENNFRLQLTKYFLEDTLHEEAAGRGSLDIVHYLISTFDLVPNGITLYRAAFSGSLELMRYLLNPDNNFGLQVDQDLLNNLIKESSRNAGLIEHLLPSDLAFNQALEHLQQSDYDATELSLQKSSDFCLNHFSLRMKHIVSYPQSYQLTHEALQFLKNVWEEVKISKEVKRPRLEGSTDVSESHKPAI